MKSKLAKTVPKQELAKQYDEYVAQKAVHNLAVKPKPTPIYKPVPKPNKDLSFFHPAQEVIRNDINKHKNIPHKDYIPTYVPPYYNIKESGFTNVRHDDIFRKE